MTDAAPEFDLEAEIEDAIAAYQFDPQNWTLFAFDWGQGDLAGIEGPREWQAAVNEDIRAHLTDPEKRYQPLWISVASGHGVGKSAHIAMITNWAMSCFDDAKIVITANTEKQLTTKTSPEVGKWFRKSITAHWFDVNAGAVKSRDPEHKDSWKTDFITWSEHNTEAFAGLHNLRKIIVLVFDEASNIADKVWEVAEGAMTDEETVIIWIAYGNPTRNSGRFRECFRRFRNRWITRQVDSRTVPGTNKTQIAKWVEDYGEDSDFVKIRVRGQFPTQSAMQFISEVDADKAQAAYPHITAGMVEHAPTIIGVDPAWTGTDSMEIYLRRGLYTKHLKTIPRNDDDFAMATLIAGFEDEYQADAVFVDAGYGTGIVSCGRQLGRTWILVWFGSTTTPDKGFFNMRAYIWGQLKAALKAGLAIDPKDQILYDDLVGPETVPRADGKIQLESKEDMKARGIPSPNKADSLALTFAAPVTKKPRTPVIGRGNQRHQSEWNPNSVMNQ